MSAIISQVLRRQLSSAAPSAGEHSGNYKFWKRLSFFVAFPAIGLCMANAYMLHKEESHQERPPFVKYEYMYRREKRFPWGDGTKSLFHNPHTNALPNGYEDEH